MAEPSSDHTGAPNRRSKRTLFLAFVLGALLVAAGASLFFHLAVERPGDQEIRLAVLAPLSGPDQRLGQSIEGGAALFAAQINQAGGIAGQPLRLIVLDDGNDPEQARRAAEQAVADGAVGVIGHWSDAAAAAAAEVYQRHGVPLLTTAGSPPGAVNPWVFHSGYDQDFEIRFLANYVRNVIGEKTLSVIHPAGAEGEALVAAFDQTLQRFGTRVVYRWDYPATPAADPGPREREIVADIADKKLIGAILILGQPQASARMLAALRQAGLRNRVIGPRTLATTAFQAAVADQAADKDAAAAILNGVLTTTPLLFDTAGEEAQNFRNAYINRHRISPDWLAASSFDAARLFAQALARNAATAPATTGPAGLDQQRQQLRQRLASLDGRPGHDDGQTGDVPGGLLGPVAFDAKGVAAVPVLTGSYDGVDLVAALTQLSPIREINAANYLDEVVAGRALYVNDRFMYKTNVIYSGIKLNKVSALSLGNSTVDLDFTLWFRWRGALEPQDIVFTNAAEPIRLDKPFREAQIGDMNYRSYQAKGKFFLNYTAASRAYGTQLVGIAFRHRTLVRNNLLYVSDIVGMDLNNRLTLGEQISQSNVLQPVGTKAADSSLVGRLAALLPGGAGSADPLVQAMLNSRVLAGIAGWVLERARISQQVIHRGAEGDPTFVGFGKPQPEFSQLDLGVLLRPDQVNARDLIPSSYFPYIAIFSLVGSILASLLDRKDRGQFWRMQTLGLRILTWPLLLISAGNLGLDYGLRNFTTATVDSIVMVYSALWWLIPARLLGISVERFIWVPLEIRAGRKIPNIIRRITSLVIYLFGFFGVVAFVMGQTITSLLATSGLMAMIIGLAIQANIANIFSGIVLNIERPFKVGDYVKISATIMGEVIDITWRTIRIRHLEGQLVCMPNAKVSEAEIHNYSDMGPNFVRLALFVDPKYDPRLVSRLIKEALDTFDIFQNLTSNYFGPDAQFKGIECTNGLWAARYRVKFYLMKGQDDNRVVHEVWVRIWERFQVNGIDWAGPYRDLAPPAALLPPPLPADGPKALPAGAA